MADLSQTGLETPGAGKRVYYTAFEPNEDGAGAKGSAAFPSLLKTAFVQLFRRSATTLTKPTDTPTDDVTYTFASAEATGITNSWETSIPSGTEDVYTISVNIASTEDTYDITPEEWSDPVIWSESTLSPIIINLTNDNVSVPADFDGTNPNLTDAVTEVMIYEGQVDVTNLWTITPDPSTGISGTFVDNVYTVTSLTVDYAHVDFDATRSGYPSQTIRFTVSKAKAGSDGETVTVYSVKSAVAAIKRDSSGNYTPDDLVVNAYSITGQAARQDYSGRFKIYTSDDGGDTFDLDYTSAGNENTYSYTLPAGITHVKLELFLAGGTTTLVDDEIIPVVADGIGAITVNLSNDNVTVPADYDGSNPVLTEATTDVAVYEGGVDVTGDWTITPYLGTGISGTFVSNTWTTSTLTADNSYVDFEATRTGYTTQVIRFTISKAKAGSDGTPATVYIAEPSVGAIKKDNTDTYIPTTVTFNAYSVTGTGDRQDYSGRFIIATSDGGVSWSDQYTSASDESSYEYTIPADITHVRVSLYEAGGTATLVDREVVPIIQDGADGTNGIAGVVANLDNDSCTLPANSSGVVTSYANGVTTITIYEGGVDVTDDWSISPAINSGVTAGSWNDVNHTYTITAFSSGAISTGSVEFTCTRSGYANLYAVFSVSKVNAGADGTDGTDGTDGSTPNYQFLTTSVAVASKDSDTTFAPTSVTIKGWEFNSSGNKISYSGWIKVFSSTNGGVTYASTPRHSTSGSSTTYSFDDTSTGGAKVTHFKVQLLTSEFGSVLDEEILPVIFKAEQGEEGTRGSRHFYVEIIGSSWSNTAANNHISGLGLTKVIADIVTEYDDTFGYSETRFWDGSVWTVVDEVIDGNLLVEGTIGGSKLAATNIITDSLQIGNFVIDTDNVANKAINNISVNVNGSTVQSSSAGLLDFVSDTITSTDGSDIYIDMFSPLKVTLDGGSSLPQSNLIPWGIYWEDNLSNDGYVWGSTNAISVIHVDDLSWYGVINQTGIFQSAVAGRSYTFTLQVELPSGTNDISSIGSNGARDKYVRLQEIFK